MVTSVSGPLTLRASTALRRHHVLPTEEKKSREGDDLYADQEIILTGRVSGINPSDLRQWSFAWLLKRRAVGNTAIL